MQIRESQVLAVSKEEDLEKRLCKKGSMIEVLHLFK